MIFIKITAHCGKNIPHTLHFCILLKNTNDKETKFIERQLNHILGLKVVQNNPSNLKNVNMFTLYLNFACILYFLFKHCVFSRVKKGWSEIWVKIWVKM